MAIWIPRPKPPVYDGDPLAIKRCEEIDAEIGAYGLARLQKAYPDHDFTDVMKLVREYALFYIEMRISPHYDAELKCAIALDAVVRAARMNDA